MEDKKLDSAQDVNAANQQIEGEENRNVSNSEPLDKKELAENLSASDSSLEKPKDQEE